MNEKGLIPVAVIFILATALFLGVVVEYNICHVETKEERHQRQVEFR